MEGPNSAFSDPDPLNRLNPVPKHRLIASFLYPPWICVCRLADLKETIGKLAAVLVAAPTSKLQAVYAKYSNKKFMKIARY
jgi:hypothetical protein